MQRENIAYWCVINDNKIYDVMRENTINTKNKKLDEICMIYGYVRVGTQDQSVDSQKNSISRYYIAQKLMMDEWVELEMSSRKSTAHRGIDKLLNKLSPNDIVISSELSCLSRSIFNKGWF